MSLIRLVAASLVLSVPALAGEPEIEIFVDRNETYIRAGTDSGLQVGSALNVVGARIGSTPERRRRAQGERSGGLLPAENDAPAGYDPGPPS